MEAVHEDGGDGSMQCPNHPYRNSTPGGICAFCLQEKLGKLVSSSYAVAVFPSSSSSSSPSFRSAAAAAEGRAASSAALSHKPKKTKDERSSDMVFKRSKSTATPRKGIHFFDEKYVEDYSPNRRRFWKFLHLSKHPASRKSEKHVKNLNFSSPRSRERDGERKDYMVVDCDNSEATFDRKVSRSRSVGCGSRSFSNDFFEKISGFGDCTLRRVESQREGKIKMQSLERGGDCTRRRERVRCGGIFGGFVLSSSSSNLIGIGSSSDGGKSLGQSLSHGHGRSKNWGWAFASPMRAFGKSSAGKRDAVSSKNAAPNLAAIPSLLAVGN